MDIIPAQFKFVVRNRRGAARDRTCDDAHRADHVVLHVISTWCRCSVQMNMYVHVQVQLRLNVFDV